MIPTREGQMSMEEMTANIKSALDEKGREWVIGAMMEGSIGYHTASSANMLIDQFLRGDKESWCERCYALYGSNLVHMMHDDVALMHRLAPEKQEKLVQIVKVTMGWSQENQMGLSFAYPTMGI